MSAMNQKSSKTAPPDIEKRFLPPEGWRWHSFRNPQGRMLRFGTAAPQKTVPDAIVIGLPGLSEFTEKYFELAGILLAHNLSFWMMDWQGQGRSDRHLKNPHKRHATSFNQDIADLHFFIMEYIKHSAVHPDVGRIPLVLLGHSMGGNIGLHYLHRHPDMISCAAFTAPMIEIKALKALTLWLRLSLSGSFSALMGKAYIFSGKDWSPDTSTQKKVRPLSSDPVRSTIQNKWCTYDPALQVGNVTFTWLHEALLSCHRLQQKNVAAEITTPCLFGLAGNDDLVSNASARSFVKKMPHAEILELPNAHHEILMEQDDIRDNFLNHFYHFLDINNVREKRKPF